MTDGMLFSILFFLFRLTVGCSAPTVSRTTVSSGPWLTIPARARCGRRTSSATVPSVARACTTLATPPSNPQRSSLTWERSAGERETLDFFFSNIRRRYFRICWCRHHPRPLLVCHWWRASVSSAASVVGILDFFPLNFRLFWDELVYFVFFSNIFFSRIYILFSHMVLFVVFKGFSLFFSDIAWSSQLLCGLFSSSLYYQLHWVVFGFWLFSNYWILTRTIFSLFL